MIDILRFNWPRYVQGLAAVGLAAGLLALLPLPPAFAALVALGGGLAAAWLLLSLAASYLVYDRSALCRWDWIAAALEREPASWVNIHAGFDPTRSALARLFPGARGRALDIFDPREMTEPSLIRARANAAPAETADFRRLPLADRSADLVTLLLAAHEIRDPAARAVFFAELSRVLAPRGTLLLAEHLRDPANFLAFGPGFWHFHSRRTWLAAARAAALRVEREFAITPFVRVFVLAREV